MSHDAVEYLLHADREFPPSPEFPVAVVSAVTTGDCGAVHPSRRGQQIGRHRVELAGVRLFDSASVGGRLGQ